MSAPLTARDSEERTVSVEGTELKLLSYRIGERYFARVHDLALGDLLGRGSGATRSEAHQAATDAASLRLGLSAAKTSMERALAHLGGDKRGSR